MNAVFVLDKPAGITSHDVVSRVRRITGERAVGHLGTLDPMATGVLPLVLGSFTRLAQFYLASEKQYEGEIRLGFATDTYDAEGIPTSELQPATATLDEIAALAGRFRGEIQQTPPPFSAKKLGGVPAHKLARKTRSGGAAVRLAPVQVTVHELEIFAPAAGNNGAGEGCRSIGFRARVSSGTYLRSLAHDLGHALGVGGHLSRLRRTAVAEFALVEALTLEQLAAAAAANRLASVAVHPRRLLPDMPAVTASDQAVAALRHGRAVNLPDVSGAPLVKVFAGQAEFVAVARRIAGTLFQPKIVLASC